MRTLPAAPLQQALEARRRSLRMTVNQFAIYLGVTHRTVERLMVSEVVGDIAADRMATRLSIHPALLWGQDFYEKEKVTA